MIEELSPSEVADRNAPPPPPGSMNGVVMWIEDRDRWNFCSYCVRFGLSIVGLDWVSRHQSARPQGELFANTGDKIKLESEEEQIKIRWYRVFQNFAQNVNLLSLHTQKIVGRGKVTFRDALHLKKGASSLTFVTLQNFVHFFRAEICIYFRRISVVHPLFFQKYPDINRMETGGIYNFGPSIPYFYI